MARYIRERGEGMSDMKFGELDGVQYAAMDTMQMAKEWLKAKSENFSLRVKLQIAVEALEKIQNPEFIDTIDGGKIHPYWLDFSIELATEALEKIK